MKEEKKPFMKIVPVRALNRDTVIKLITAYVLVFWVTPLITLIPQTITRTSLANWYLLIIVPVSLLAVGYVIGMSYGFYPLLIVGVVIGSIPSFLVYGFLPAWQYSIFYAVIIGSGNIVTEINKTTSREKQKKF